MKRCDWVDLKNPLYIEYHDKDWGVPVHNDRLLFEMLILEGAQAGLSWSTILKKRKNYKKAFDNFDPKKVAKYSQTKINQLLKEEGIIRNKLKLILQFKMRVSFLKFKKSSSHLITTSGHTSTINQSKTNSKQ